MGGALIGKSRLLEIDAREFVSSHTDCCTTPANALSAHLHENGFFLGTITEIISVPQRRFKSSMASCFESTVFLYLSFPRIEAGHLEAEIMTPVELGCAGGILLAGRQQ